MLPYVTLMILRKTIDSINQKHIKLSDRSMHGALEIRVSVHGGYDGYFNTANTR